MVTMEQIATLRDEAAAAGDTEMVEVATRALSGDDAALTECVAVIVAAREMAAGDVEIGESDAEA